MIKEFTCWDCHHSCKVKGKLACARITRGLDKPCYRFLESDKICEDFWMKKRKQEVKRKRGNLARE